MTATHFTAWLTDDPSCLDQPNVDLNIWQDMLTTGDGDQDGDWACDPGQGTFFNAITSVNAEDGDVDDAMAEAKNLMEAAGWRIVGDWQPAGNAYTVTVERAA